MGVIMWIEYDTGTPKLQWENSETREIIQSYGNDVRYPDFKKKLDSGEIVPVKWEDTQEYKDATASELAQREAFQLAK